MEKVSKIIYNITASYFQRLLQKRKKHDHVPRRVLRVVFSKHTEVLVNL